MSKRIILLVAVLVALTAFFTLQSTSVRAEQTSVTTIRLTHGFSPDYLVAQACQLFADEVKKKTKDKLIVKIFPAAQLYKQSETIDPVTRGDIEMGVTVFASWASYFKLAKLENLPFIITSYETWEEASKGWLGEQIERNMEKVGARPLMWLPYGLQMAILNSKRPLVKPEDFNGLKIRAAGTSSPIFSALGAKPTLISPSEAYLALQHGTVDGVYTGAEGAVKRKYYEIQKYVTIAPLCFVQFVVILNNDCWKKLPQDFRQVITECAQDVSKWYAPRQRQAEQKNIEILQKNIDTHILTKQEIAEWRKFTDSVINDFVKEGGEEGKKAIDVLRQLEKS